MRERVWGTLSAEDWGKGILPGTVNKQAGPGQRGFRGRRGMRPATGSGKGCESGRGKLYRRQGKTHFLCEL
jgi:hypothetical protein